jgi:hypothetical protein
MIFPLPHRVGEEVEVVGLLSSAGKRATEHRRVVEMALAKRHTISGPD